MHSTRLLQPKLQKRISRCPPVIPDIEIAFKASSPHCQTKGIMQANGLTIWIVNYYKGGAVPIGII